MQLSTRQLIALMAGWQPLLHGSLLLYHLWFLSSKNESAHMGKKTAETYLSAEALPSRALSLTSSPVLLSSTCPPFFLVQAIPNLLSHFMHIFYMMVFKNYFNYVIVVVGVVHVKAVVVPGG